MATTGKPGSIGYWRDIKANWDELAIGELLDIDEPITARDVGAAERETPSCRLEGAVGVGVLTKLDERRVVRDDEGRVVYLRQYKVPDSVRADLEQYRAERSELPCGHGAHVHRIDDGAFGCKYCGREFDRDVVEEAMSG